MNPIRTTLALAICAASATGSLARAPDTSQSLRTQIAQSDLVFVGSVTDVSYAPTADEHAIPHTFVTYEVEEVLQGEAQAKSVTLRFIGGRGEEASFLLVSDQPMFDKGDRDVLMVHHNGRSACPLVGCSAGRYRLIDDLVFTEEGRGIELAEDGGIGARGYYALEEVMTHKVSQTILARKDSLPEGETRQLPEQGRGALMPTSQFIERVAETARSVGRATPGVFRSADIHAPFSIQMREAPAPDVPEVPASARRSAEEIAELEASLADGKN